MRETKSIHAVPVAAAILLGIVGCAGSSEQSSPEPSETVYFEGTVEEWRQLTIACLRDNGLVAEAGREDTEIMYGSEDLTPAESRDILDSCSAEIGYIQVEGLSEEQLRSRYDARVAQFECLKRNGLIEGEAISFESFVDRYNRSGQQELWAPSLEADNPPDMGSSDVCPIEDSF